MNIVNTQLISFLMVQKGMQWNVSSLPHKFPSPPSRTKSTIVSFLCTLPEIIYPYILCVWMCVYIVSFSFLWRINESMIYILFVFLLYHQGPSTSAQSYLTLVNSCKIYSSVRMYHVLSGSCYWTFSLQSLLP